MERKRNQDALEIVNEKRLMTESIINKRWKMVGHTLKHPEELHYTILDVTIEGKRLPEHRNTFIRQIKEDAGDGSYRVLKEIIINCEKWRRRVINQPTG